MPKAQISKSASSKKLNNSITINDVPWREQLSLINLDTLHEYRRVQFAILNERNPKHFDKIEKFQNYAYVYNVLNVKPVVHEEILFIIKHYPAWDRPFVPPNIENIFREANVEAKGYLKKKKPIPLDLMVSLIKLRAILLLYEDLYCEANLAVDFSFGKMDTGSSCTVTSDASYEEQQEVKEAESHIIKTLEETHLDLIPELDFIQDYDTLNVFFHTCSTVLQGYILAIQRLQLENEKRKLNASLADFKEGKQVTHKVTVPWIIKHCKDKKTYRTTTLSDVGKQKTKFSFSSQQTFKVLYMVLIGFYDCTLIPCMDENGLSMCSLIGIGEFNHAQANQSKSSKSKCSNVSGVSEDTVSSYIVVPVYSYSEQLKHGSTKMRICADNYEELKTNLVKDFWENAEGMSESRKSLMKNVIWFNCNFEYDHACHGTYEYFRQSKEIYDSVCNHLHSIPSLMKFYELYMQNIKIKSVGDTPEKVPIGRMFYYNDFLTRIPPDCMNVGFILDGLLNEVCSRESDDSSSETDCLLSRTIQLRNKRMKQVYRKLLSKYKFAYTPVDPIIFHHQHLMLFAPFKGIKMNRTKFETYDSNNIHLTTRYYGTLKSKLHNYCIKYIRKSVPALLWYKYENQDGDYESRTKNSRVYHTWLTLIKLTNKESREGLAINMCDLVKCHPKLDNLPKECVKCNIHYYFSKPEKEGAIINMGVINDDCSSVASHQTGVLTNLYELFEAHDFQWQEDLHSDVLLQEIVTAFNYYQCMDHLYVPFLDQILVRFHDNVDEFGTAVTAWHEYLRSPLSPHHFFKHTIYDESSWLQKLEENIMKTISKSFKSVSYKNESNYFIFKEFQKKPEEIPLLFSNMLDFQEIFQTAVSTTKQEKLNVFDLDDRYGTKGVSTIFHSTEGYKVTVDKVYYFSCKPTISLKVESVGNIFILHANQANHFMFHFLTSTGIRIVFAKPEEMTSSYRDEIRMKTHNFFVKKGIYEMKETTTVKFGSRSQLRRKRYLTEKILRDFLIKLLAQTNKRSSVESLKDVESGETIVIKSKMSFTDIRKRRWIINNSLLKKIKKIKKCTLPRFKILSSALHKRKYVALSKVKIYLNFGNTKKILKFIPNVNVAKKIVISKCTGATLPLKDPQQEDLKSDYDIRISLPSGLQIYTLPDTSQTKKHLVVQSYISSGPMNNDVANEVSRTFTRHGFVRIKYRDGSIKMIGTNGRTILGKVPCLEHKPIKRRSHAFEDNLKYHKYVKLRMDIHKKVNRYQKRFVDRPGKQYLNQKLYKRERYVKNILENYMRNSNMDCLNMTPRQTSTAVDFKICRESFRNHYTFDVYTNDAFSTINNEGELTTTFADGTKITSWFKIEQNMIVIPDRDDISIGQIESDADDYLCNFLIPKTGGFVSVVMCYQYEHPHYATIQYRADIETFIFLPENIEVKILSDKTYHTNFDDKMFADITKDEIKLHTNFCRKCYDMCETSVNIKHLYNNNNDVPPGEFLLETKDNFNKCFKVDYGGICYKNEDWKPGNVKSCCRTHHIEEMEKFYVFDRKFRGKAYWTHKMFLNRILTVQYNNKERVKYYLDEKEIMRAYEIMSYYKIHYCDRFLMQYRIPDPNMFKMLSSTTTRKDSPIDCVAYIKKRVFEILPDSKSVLPLFNIICKENVKRPWDLPLPEKVVKIDEDRDFKGRELRCSFSTEDLKIHLPPHFTPVALDDFKSLHEKAKKFKIGLYEEVNSLTRLIDNKCCECVGEDDHTYPQVSEKFSKIDPAKNIRGYSENLFYHFIARYNSGQLQLKLKTSSSHMVSDVQKYPVVPANSCTSPLRIIDSETSTKSGSELLTGNSIIASTPSLSGFTIYPVQSQCFKQVRPNMRLKSTKDFQKPIANVSTTIKNRVISKPQLIEWRRPTKGTSSTSTVILDTLNKSDVPKRKVKRTKNDKSKATMTTHTFDLLYMEEFTEREEKKILRDQQHISKSFTVSHVDLTFYLPPSKFSRNNRAALNSSKKLASKQKSVIIKETSSSGTEPLKECNKVFNAMSDFKLSESQMKKSYTECRKKEAKKQMELDDSDVVVPKILDSTTEKSQSLSN